MYLQMMYRRLGCPLLLLNTCLLFCFRQTLPAEAGSRLSDLSDKLSDVEVVGIDEGQFVSYSLYD